MDEFKKIGRFLITLLGGVLIWRGTWIAADLYLFPDNIQLSMAACIVGGLIIIFVMGYQNF